MHRRTGLSIVATMCAAALILPAVAAAKTKIVYAGPPKGAQKIAAKLVPKSFATKYNPSINAFFRQKTTINVGDTVSFVLHGFHTIDLPGKSGTDLPFATPGATVTGAKDSAGIPFWFNGNPTFGINPQLFGRSKSRKYNGSKRIDSGAASSKPLNVKFTKAGTYKFFCDIHPGMVGYVVVKPKGKSVPTAKQDAAALTAQVTANIKAAKKLAKTKLPANTVSLGEGARSGVELFAMFPATLTVPHGTTVTFQISRFSRESHTASFGPFPYLKPLSQSFHSPVFAPAGTYPSDPTQPLVLTPKSHGNGFVNTGTLDQDPTTKPGPSSKITFTTPGTYHFVCLIHPQMQGTIIVK